ncbi:hypothetical protein V3C99_018591, partial [Haemonchus contortus]
AEFRATSTDEDEGCRFYAKESTIRWAGLVMRYSGDRWTRTVTERISRDVKEPQEGRQRDGLTKVMSGMNATGMNHMLRVLRARAMQWTTFKSRMESC